MKKLLWSQALEAIVVFKVAHLNIRIAFDHFPLLDLS